MTIRLRQDGSSADTSETHTFDRNRFCVRLTATVKHGAQWIKKLGAGPANVGELFHFYTWFMWYHYYWSGAGKSTSWLSPRPAPAQLLPATYFLALPNPLFDTLFDRREALMSGLIIEASLEGDGMAKRADSRPETRPRDSRPPSVGSP